MTPMDTIFGRRSIRAYTDDAPSAEQIEQIQRAAMAAPSAGNVQPWHLIRIDNPALLQRISEIHPYARMTANAPLAFVACADPSVERFPGFWPQDLSAAVQNLLLAAHAQGLGAVWCGLYPDEDRVRDFRELLHIPDSIYPFALIPVGVPAEHKGPVDRYQPERIHSNGW